MHTRLNCVKQRSGGRNLSNLRSALDEALRYAENNGFINFDVDFSSNDENITENEDEPDSDESVVETDNTDVTDRVVVVDDVSGATGIEDTSDW